MAEVKEIIRSYESKRKEEIALTRKMSESALRVSVEAEDVDETAPLPVARMFRDILQNEPGDQIDQTLRELFNSYFLQHCEVNNAPLEAGFLRVNHIKGTCAKAEYHFVNAYKQIYLSHENDDFHPVLCVIHDEEGRPVVLKKYHDTSTGLLLESTIVGDDLVLPAGTIVQTPHLRPSIQTGEAEGSSHESRFKSYGVPRGQLDCAPLRLSPWAYREADDRECFAVTQELDSLSVSFSRRYQCVKYSIDMFRQAADNLLERCITV